MHWIRLSVALNLHDFYNGLERIFERIAENIDEIKPEGLNWHQEILKQIIGYNDVSFFSRLAQVVLVI